MTKAKIRNIGKKDTVTRFKDEMSALKKEIKRLKESEDFLMHQITILRDIFDTVRDGIVYTTLNGKVISVNQALLEIVEVPKEKIVNRSVLTIAAELLHPKDAGNILPLLRGVITGKDMKPFRVTYKDKILDVSAYKSPETRMITGIIRDITESTRANDALLKSESRLRRAELSSKSGNWELHLESGKMIGSQGAAKLYGVKAESLDYKVVRDIPLPEYRNMMDAALDDLINGNKPYNIEFKIRKVDTGEIIDIHSVAEYDREHKILYGSIQDITDRKKIEEQLLTKNRDFSKLFMISLRLLESIDKKELLCNIADSAASLAGADASAIYLVKGDELMLAATAPSLPDDFPDEFRKAKLTHHPHIQAVIKTRTTSVITDLSKVTLTEQERMISTTRNLVSLVYIPLFVQNKVEGVLILGTIGRKYDFEKHEIDLFNTYSNITSMVLENSYLFDNLKVNIEKAEESNRLKTAFLHNISHEIRTPLNAIIGFSTLLGQPDLMAEKSHEYISIIHQSNNQLLSIIDDILNISHIEARQVLTSESPADLHVILHNLHGQYLPQAVNKGLDFHIDDQLPGPDFIVLTDESKLISILSNLLNNAFKFTNEGSVDIGCSIMNEQVEFYVEDTGIGIPVKEQTRIFERFYQVDKAVSRLYGGMGLGLSISAAYLEMLGGKFTLHSTPGKGSRFSFTLPCKMAKPVVHITSEKQASNPDIKAWEKTILVAEDEDSNFAFIQAVLTSVGYKILRAFNGLEALHMCYDYPDIDLILMDIRMPVKDGYASTVEIKKIRPQLPIIAQTAYGYPGDIHTAREKGCSDYLTKPFSKNQLIELVKKHINRAGIY
ncbi:MAG: response regulator [Bacteroidales bacterium]|nr:response regulator [Bacteroidales bacterium]